MQEIKNDIPSLNGKISVQPQLHIRNAAIAAAVCALLTVTPNQSKAEDIPREKAYTLTEYTRADETAPLPDNVITKYEINAETKAVEPKYYSVSLNKTEYGDTANHNDANNKYFKWTTTNGKTTLESATQSEANITYYINNTRTDAASRITSPGAIIENNFQNLTATVTNYAEGGALYNNGSALTSVTGDFIGNRAESLSKSAEGGAFFNDYNGNLTSLTGDFINNTSFGNGASGGAVYNSGSIGDLTGNFINNTSVSQGFGTSGGAITNRGTITNLKGDFISNSAVTAIDSSDAHASAGALSNGGTIMTLTSSFIGNSVSAHGNAEGGAIYNGGGSIGKITGDFIGNNVSSSAAHSSSAYAHGGAIYNTQASIESITGDFIGNTAISVAQARGGAIYIYGGEVGSISGDFIGNYTKEYTGTQDKYSGYGGAIYNSNSSSGNKAGHITQIDGDFIENSSGSGGAIYNSGKIDLINGNFIKNYASSTGGAIHNYDDWRKTAFGQINGDFIENTAGEAGGAIYNESVIGDINGGFYKNSVEYDSAKGGAIYNKSSIGDVSGVFQENYVKGESAYGGAIYSGYSYFDSLDGGFIKNSAQGEWRAQGGAIYGDYLRIEKTLESSFIENFASASNGGAEGGAIYLVNYGNTFDIKGLYQDNYAEGKSYANGGAIYNDTAIGKIEGVFTGNYASSESDASGGAIYNSGSITLKGADYGAPEGSYDDTVHGIKADFINNYASAERPSSVYAQGGAIYNGTDALIGDSIYEQHYSEGHEPMPESIINTAPETKYYGIIGKFESNEAKAHGNNLSQTEGGAVYNKGLIGLTEEIEYIDGAEPGPVFASLSLYADTPAVSESEKTVFAGILGEFVNNTVDSYSVDDVANSKGGAVYNEGVIGKDSKIIYSTSGGSVDPVSLFAGVSEQTPESSFNGIIADFKGNKVKAESENYNARGGGGAIHNEGIIGSKIITVREESSGGVAGRSFLNAKEASGSLSDGIIGVFIDNSASTKAVDSDAATFGGAIFNISLIGSVEREENEDGDIVSEKYSGGINGIFINNSVHAQSNDFARAGGGAIATVGDGIIPVIMGEFTGNSAVAEGPNAQALGGAIYNESYQGDSPKIYYYVEHTTDADGNIIKSMYIIDGMTDAEFLELLKSGGNYKLILDGEDSYTLQDQYDWAGVDNLADLIAFCEGEGYTQTNPEDLYNDNYVPPVISVDTIRDLPALTLKNTNLINNHADSENGEAKGGAIYSEGNIKLIADNGKTTFISGNYTKNGDVIDQNAIYMKGYNLIFDSTNASTIQVDDKIDGENYNFYIIGDDASRVILNNNVDNALITLDTTNLILGRDNVLNGSKLLTLNSGSISMVNGSAGAIEIPRFSLNGNTNFASDVNLANKTMDRITADTYTVNTAATLNVNYLNLLNDANQDKTYVPFAEADLANNVAYTGLSPIAYSPIYKYQVDYLKETGEFLFTRGGGGGSNPSDNFNPSVLPTPVNSQAGGYTTQLQTFNYAFQHSDTFMQIPAAQRFAIKNQNKYALSPTGDATDVGVFSPLLTKYETGGIWFKPYASFENIPLKNGPKVNNINYGTLVGFDSNLKSIKHGWERVLTGYIGYNGATQNFQGVTANQNGGLLGTTATFYKGNFFNATTLSVGATAGTNNTMYGSEDYTMLLAGIADKFGYNFEFKEGKYIIQPSMLLSYSFVNTFDYRNAAGVNIQSDPLNALQLAPGIKFIMNTKNGWQPYIGVNMVWNIMDQTKVKANDVRLPSMSIDPYVEYGVGVQRKWGERFMGYAQAMVHNGGRNGISLNGGFRWAIGKR